jgi:hypothetical protein
MIPTLSEELGWERFLEKTCRSCKIVANNGGVCPHEGLEGNCETVEKRLMVENRKVEGKYD